MLAATMGRWRALYAVLTLMLATSCGDESSSPTPPTEPEDVPVTQSRAEPEVPRGLPGPDQERIEAFLLAKGYEAADWQSQPGHLTGARVDGVAYAVHGFAEVHYSPEVAAWIAGPGIPKTAELPDGAMIVLLEFTPPASAGTERGELERIQTMVRHGASSFDGWFWSTTVVSGEPPAVDAEASRGGFGRSTCFGCHASADNDHLVFLSEEGPLSAAEVAGWEPGDLARRSAPPVERRRRGPRAAADPAFLEYFDLADVPTPVPFPRRELDRVWADPPGEDGHQRELFATSDQCLGCHDAAVLLSNSSPDMWYAEPDPETTLVDGAATPDSGAFRNFSPYGEWSASLNALSGRDPVWHAQVDFERKLRPALAHFTTDTCFSCHGPMAGRQLRADLGPDAQFTIDMFYAKPGEEHAKYGALARDGVSCAVCHQIGSQELGVDPVFEPRDGGGFELPRPPSELNTYTALFPDPDLRDPRNPFSNAYWGPYPNERIQSAVMDKVLGRKGAWGAPRTAAQGAATPQIHESKLCGSCHTVLVPALPVGYELPAGITNPFLDPDMKMSFEQTTYFEWRNSQFENELERTRPTAMTCQACHMASHAPESVDPWEDRAERIVNTESDRFPPVRGRSAASVTFAPQGPTYRHVLLGINYFVFEMLEQFPDVLGSTQIDDRVPANTLEPTVNARDWIENHAKRITAALRITGLAEVGDQLETEVEVTNLAGHKFPTGAGFRRAFLRFEVLGAEGEVLWASGRTSPLGVILGADGEPLASEETVIPGESAPHHQIITRQDQVQVYETRALDSGIPEGPRERDPQLQTTVLGIYHEYKDNRILPLGWAPRAPSPRTVAPWSTDGSPAVDLFAAAPLLVADKASQPDGVVVEAPADAPEDAREHPLGEEYGYEVVYDPDYWSPQQAGNGQDHIRYRIPLASIEGWQRVRATLLYQTIPPYYLRDRFQTGQADRFPVERDMGRLVHLASRLDLEGTPAEGWSLAIGDPVEKRKGQEADPRLSRDAAQQLLKQHYDYLENLQR